MTLTNLKSGAKITGLCILVVIIGLFAAVLIPFILAIIVGVFGRAIYLMKKENHHESKDYIESTTKDQHHHNPDTYVSGRRSNTQ